MSKVVYLLGAGASYGKRKQIIHRTMEGTISSGKYSIAEGLPVVNEINTEISYLIEDLKQSDENYESKDSKMGQLINDLIWLRNESTRHMTVDTFAKSFFCKVTS